MRFIHSSDLQIGMVFKYFEPDAAAALKAARHAVVPDDGGAGGQVSGVGGVAGRRHLRQATAHIRHPAEADRGHAPIPAGSRGI